MVEKPRSMTAARAVVLAAAAVGTVGATPEQAKASPRKAPVKRGAKAAVKAAGRKVARKRTPDAQGKVRAVKYGPKVVEKICARLTQGETWFDMCNTDGLPSYTTFYTWQEKHPEFAEAVFKARQQGADFCADEALRVAQAATRETVQQDRLLVTTLMRRAALIAPKAWGGKGEKGGAGASKDGAAVTAPAAPLEVVFRVRHFERVVGEDGRAFVRELLPEGQA